MRLIASFLFVLITVVHVDIGVGLFLNNCPEKRMWNLRAKNMCGTTDKYMCLYDTNAGKFRELCKDKPEFHRPGNIFIISGNLQYFAARSCKGDRYQPHKWWTNGSSDCQYLKSTCNDEGQVPYDNGTISRNTKCRCDYTNYYTFVSSTRNKCSCDPTEEDCSCNIKKCSMDQVLTPDYDCVGIDAWTGRYVCPEYKAPTCLEFMLWNKCYPCYEYNFNRITKEKKLPRRSTICPFIKPDFPGTMHQSRARIANTTMFGIITLFGIIALVFAINRQTTLRERQKIGEGLKEHDKNKIRLLKNYHEIVDNIVPSDIISHMSDGIFSPNDLTEIEDMLTRTEKARRLIDILINTDQSGYRSFMVGLKKNEDLKQLAITIENTKVFDTDYVRNFSPLVTDTVPKNIKNLHNILLTDWIEYDNKHIVYTDAVLNLYSKLQYKDCVTIVGPRGSGKSATLRSTVLMLMTSSDFEIIPCTEPSEILSYLNTHRNQIFLFDDVCETHNGADSFLSEWNKKSRLIETMIKTTDNARKKKMLFVFDAISFETVKMRRQWSSIFSQNVFNMLSPNNRLKEEDANEIAKRYECKENNDLHLYKDQFGFYPELCRRYGSCKDKEEHIESVAFQIMDDFLKDLTDEDEVLLATLSIFVIFGNNITHDMLHSTIRKKLSDISRVLYLTTDMLSTSTIRHKLTMMIESNMYIQENSNTYTFISPAIFMGVVSFFCNHYFHFILELSTFDSLSYRLGEWKTYIKDRKIKLPNHRESTEKYFHDLSGEVSWWQNKLTYKPP